MGIVPPRRLGKATLQGIALALAGVWAGGAAAYTPCAGSSSGSVGADPYYMPNTNTISGLRAFDNQTFTDFFNFDGSAQNLLQLLQSQGLEATSVANNETEATTYYVQLPECVNMGGTSAVVPDDLRQDLRLLSNIWRIRNANRPKSGNQLAGAPHGGAFMAAGDGETALPINTWVSYTYGDLASDFKAQGFDLGYDADSHNVMAGADVMLNDRLVLGLSVSYQNLAYDTVFNGGETDSDGYSVTPYAAVMINDIFSVDVSAGYTGLDYDTTRTLGGGILVGDFDADRWYAAANANASIIRGNWITGFRLGLSHATEDQDTVVEREVELTQIALAGDLTYSMGAFEPFGMIAYYHDLGSDDGTLVTDFPANLTVLRPDDDDEVQFTVGLRYFAENNVIGSLEYTRVEAREDYDANLVMLTLRLGL